MLVSVIIPAFNVDSYIVETIESILNQTYREIEIIVINDGSTDNTLDKLEYLSNQHSNIKLFSRNNSGLSSTRNFGMKKSVGDYIIFLDGDDLLTNTAIESCIGKFAKDESIDVVLFDAYPFFDEDCYDTEKSNFTYRRDKTLYGKVILGDDFFNQCIKLNCYIPSACLYMVRRKTLINLEFYPDIYHEDHLFTTLLLFLQPRVYLLEKALYLRRFRNNSITTIRKNSKHANGYLTVAKQLIDIHENIICKNELFNKYICDLLYATIEICDLLEMIDKSLIYESRSLYNEKMKKNLKYNIKINYTMLFKLIKRILK